MEDEDLMGRMTKPRRRLTYGIVVGLCLGFCLLVLVGAKYYSWTSFGQSTAAGVSERRFGVAEYLTIRTEGVDAAGHTVSGVASGTVWRWSVPRLIATILLSAAALFGAALIYRWGVGRTLPIGFCDRCGYDLSAVRTDRCPECGNEQSTGSCG